ncbi:hypothetical protein [Mucilaginibacter rubeus]|uniref:Uncharacterized protein n=1 Tax=Mucilaginibacter rubeus TaxID=2027860 RepID=A0A5C1I258_9SPHI|nr:hypothetical protein [Mucilaginibacter rubeus]QEM11390.1 hypothetical protein DEO27_015600 [Mucilaginibacter rubeus]
MKKLKLKAIELGANEMMTRAQLKNVLVGVIGGATGPDCLPRGSGCSQVTEQTNCCGSGRCLPDPNNAFGYSCM